MRISGAMALPLAAMFVVGSAEKAAYSQSLGEVARREAERRNEVRGTSRAYTNDDLRIDGVTTGLVQPSLPAEEPAPPVRATGSTAIPGLPPGLTFEERNGKINLIAPAPSEKADQPYWRARAKDVRERLAKATSDLAAAQSNLAVLDKGPTSPAVARERQIVEALVARLQSDVQYRQRDLNSLEKQVEMNKVPAEWIR